MLALHVDTNHGICIGTAVLFTCSIILAPLLVLDTTAYAARTDYIHASLGDGSLLYTPYHLLIR